MKNKFALPILIVLILTVPASATPLIGPNLAQFSVVAGGYATYGAGAAVSGEVGAVDYVVGGANATSAGDRVATIGVTGALTAPRAAQNALNRMQTTSILAPTVGGIIELAPGVDSASALTTAAGTTPYLDGGGIDDPLWVFNIPTCLVTGASTSFLGTVMSGAYIRQGADSDFSFGNLFAGSYVSISAGSRLGLAANLAIVDGLVQAGAGLADTIAAPVPEPESILLAGQAWPLRL